jgi:hypothetical protein
MRVLIVGGYGTFGGRLVELLRDEPRLTLLVGGRSLARARAFCRAKARPTGAQVLPAEFDREGDAQAQLAKQAPDLVIDASGPFQSYGSQPYRLAAACVTLGIDYLDLADGTDFVRGIAALNADATKRGVFLLSGASSFPVLTTAVARRLSADMARVDAIRGGIAPSPHARVGVNVIRAVAGYAGCDIELRRNGQRAFGSGFLEQKRYTISPPGEVPLDGRLFSLVDVPDLRSLPEAFPGLREAWMGVAPVPEILHRLLIVAAWLRRLRLVPSLRFFAPLLHWAVSTFRWGEHRGGMFITLDGARGDGRALTRSWHLIAEGDDGPYIPCMAAELLVRKLLAGTRPCAGARSAAGELDLDDYERLFAVRRIVTGVRETTASDAPLYARLLGTLWHELPAQIRTMHDVRHEQTAAGVANVTCGTSLLARCVAMLIGLPNSASQIATRVHFKVSGASERWTRSFGTRSFASDQAAALGDDDGLMCERFGPLSMLLALRWNGEQLRLILRRWRFLGVPLPRWLAPICDAYECVDAGRFRFNVRIAHPLTGLIVHYQGWLVPQDSPQPLCNPSSPRQEPEAGAPGRTPVKTGDSVSAGILVR